MLRDFGRKAEALRQRLEPRWRYEVPDGLDLDAIPDDVLDVYELAIAPVEFERAGGARRAARALRQGSNNWTISAAARPAAARSWPTTRTAPRASRRCATSRTSSRRG